MSDATAPATTDSPWVVPTSLSPSRVESFLSCPLAFRFSSIEKLPDLPSVATTRGSLVHRALELLFLEPAAQRTAQALDRSVATAIDEYRTHPDFTLLALDDDQTASFDADCREQFENVLRAHPHARVVIASIWRLGLSLEALRKMFSPDIAPRIVGVTPEAPGLIKHYRLREVLGFLKRHNASNAPWVIIDDNPAQYPEGVKVIPTEPQKGFDERAAAALSSELRIPLPVPAAAGGISASA